MKRVACIGKKETSPEEQNLLIKIGGWLALQGFTLSSGNAAGSERCFALGASMVNPRLVELHLPWEDMQIISAIFSDSEITKGFGKL